jgi:hypothetical protein
MPLVKNNMKLLLPVKPYILGQRFGETANNAYYKANGVVFAGHNGLDLYAKHGQPVFASHDGMAYYQTDKKLGHGVVIYSNDTFDYTSSQGIPFTARYKTIYWHFANGYPSPISTSGTPVKAGDFIGWADSTGLSMGDHLHYGFKPCNIGEPENTWYNLEQNNGYMGCIDPLPYLSTEYAEDLPVKHTFKGSIVIGDEDGEVVYLQRALRQLGLFNNPSNFNTNAITGYYGPITKAAVYEFQKKYVALDWWSKLQVATNRGDAVYSLTRAALNKLFA